MVVATNRPIKKITENDNNAKIKRDGIIVKLKNLNPLSKPSVNESTKIDEILQFFSIATTYKHKIIDELFLQAHIVCCQPIEISFQQNAI